MDKNSTVNNDAKESLDEAFRSLDTLDSEDFTELNATAGTSMGSLSQQEISMLLERMNEANRLLEADTKSLSSISGSGHSRKGSDASQISLTSATSIPQERSEEAANEEDLWVLWGTIVNEWETNKKKRPQYIKDMVRKGVPHHFRAIVWQLLCGADQAPEKQLYSEYMKANSAYEKLIRRDIARTYPEHDFFKEKDGAGQEALFNVMKCYSIHDREVGYCQGSCFIVGLLLMQMPEEDSFTVLVKIMQNYNMRDMYKPSMAMLGLCIYQLENILLETYPDVHIHFKTQNFHTSMYASSWFLTLFTTTFRLPLSYRIIDVFLSEGIEIIFKVSLALITMSKEEVLSFDLEELQQFFRDELPSRVEADSDVFMNLAYNTKLNVKSMKKLEKQYAAVRTKEQEEASETRVKNSLRSEIRSLKGVVEHLERECGNLAENLVQMQVERARGKETEFNLQIELSATTRKLNAALDLNKQFANEESSRQSSLDTIKQDQLQEKDDVIQCLQQELVKVRLNEAENSILVREQKERINELEEEIKSIRETAVDNSVASLQEELIAIKLREAEANIHIKEMTQKTQFIAEAWKRFQENTRSEAAASASTQTDVLSTPKKFLRVFENKASIDVTKYEEELMSARIKEAESSMELKSLRLKVMELEAQTSLSHNQTKRLEEEMKGYIEKMEKYRQKYMSLLGKLKELGNKYTDLESKSKYDIMLANIRNAEYAQRIAELEQEISVLQMKNEVSITEGELKINENSWSNSFNEHVVRDLQDQVSELKAEVMRLENQLHKNKIGYLMKSKTVSTDPKLKTELICLNTPSIKKLIKPSTSGLTSDYVCDDKPFGPVFTDSEDDEDDNDATPKANK